MEERNIKIALHDAVGDLSGIGDRIEAVRKGVVLDAETDRARIAWQDLADSGLAGCISDLNRVINDLAEVADIEVRLIETESKALA